MSGQMVSAKSMFLTITVLSFPINKVEHLHQRFTGVKVLVPGGTAFQHLHSFSKCDVIQTVLID